MAFSMGSQFTHKVNSMDMFAVARRLGAITDTVNTVLTENDLQHSCIHGSALLTKVLHQLKFPNAYPLTVGIRIFNRAHVQWVEAHGVPKDEASVRACEDAGGAIVLLGKCAEGKISEDRWPGHLVVVVPHAFGDQHALLDVAITQAHKPEWTINLQPLCLRVSEQFVKGQKPYNADVNGSRLVYSAYPDDHSYNADADWMSIRGLSGATSQVIMRLERDSME